MPHDPIALALAEDIGPGDATVEFFIDPAQQARARIFAKELAVVSGASVAAEVFTKIDPSLTLFIESPDGNSVTREETILTIQGRAGSILTAERVALNFLQTPVRRRHADPPFRRCRRGHRRPDSRHPQDHSRPARPRKSRRQGRAAAPITVWVFTTWSWSRTTTFSPRAPPSPCKPPSPAPAPPGPACASNSKPIPSRRCELSSPSTAWDVILLDNMPPADLARRRCPGSGPSRPVRGQRRRDPRHRARHRRNRRAVDQRRRADALGPRHRLFPGVPSVTDDSSPRLDPDKLRAVLPANAIIGRQILVLRGNGFHERPRRPRRGTTVCPKVSRSSPKASAPVGAAWAANGPRRHARRSCFRSCCGPPPCPWRAGRN